MMRTSRDKAKSEGLKLAFKSSFIILLLVSMIHVDAFGQNRDKNKNPNQVKTAQHTQLLQFSGMVVDKRTLQPIPYTAIMIKSSSHGTVCDNNGYFSFVAQPLDTVEFAALGYKTNAYLIIPDTITDRYALIHLMERDTATLKTVTVYPWPSKRDFKDAFMHLNLADNNLDRAKKNLALAQEKARLTGTPMDAQANYMYAMQEEYNKLYSAGQLPPNNLLNPIAWSKFIQALKDGSLNIQ